jgi:hypothetical protein
LRRACRHGASAGLLRGLPGFGSLPAAIQRSRDWPPFHARVVKPRISTLTPQRCSAREDVAAHRRHRDRPAAQRLGIVDQ